MTDEQKLLAEIDAFLASTEANGGKRMADSTFGFKAVNDGKFLARLRGGSTMTFEKARQVRAFIADPSKAHVAGTVAA